jgi:hypothetical protein
MRGLVFAAVIPESIPLANFENLWQAVSHGKQRRKKT